MGVASAVPPIPGVVPALEETFTILSDTNKLTCEFGEGTIFCRFVVIQPLLPLAGDTPIQSFTPRPF